MPAYRLQLILSALGIELAMHGKASMTERFLIMIVAVTGVAETTAGR